MNNYKKLTPDERKKKKEIAEKEYAIRMADLCIKAMKENKLPWQKPWNPSEQILDHNIFTMESKNEPNNYYKGSNGIFLEIQRTVILKSEDPRWFTMGELYNYNLKHPDEQIYVKRGEEGFPIHFSKKQYFTKEGKPIKQTKEEEENNIIPKEYGYCIPVLKSYIVFNVNQASKIKCKDGKPVTENNKVIYLPGPAFPPLINKNDNKKDFKPIYEAQEILNKSKANILHDQSNRCFYSDYDDSIHLVKPQYFKSTNDYYDTALHELTHWTGNTKRLDREEMKRYTETKAWRAKEELIAEIGSFMLAREAKLCFNPTSNNAAYLQSWITELENKPETIIESSKKASKACNYIIDICRQNENINTFSNNEEIKITTLKKNTGR